MSYKNLTNIILLYNILKNIKRPIFISLFLVFQNISSVSLRDFTNDFEEPIHVNFSFESKKGKLVTVGLLNNNLGNLEGIEKLKIEDSEGIIKKLKNIPKLYLDLSINQIVKLPQNFTRLTNLVKLDLSLNKIFQLPDNIGDLLNLRFLYIDYNRLGIIPDSIGELTNLRELDLSHNRLTELTESIGELTKLKILKIHKNKLSHIPKSIKNLKNLEILKISDNPIE